MEITQTSAEDLIDKAVGIYSNAGAPTTKLPGSEVAEAMGSELSRAAKHELFSEDTLIEGAIQDNREPGLYKVLSSADREPLDDGTTRYDEVMRILPGFELLAVRNVKGTTQFFRSVIHVTDSGPVAIVDQVPFKFPDAIDSQRQRRITVANLTSEVMLSAFAQSGLTAANEHADPAANTSSELTVVTSELTADNASLITSLFDPNLYDLWQYSVTEGGVHPTHLEGLKTGYSQVGNMCIKGFTADESEIIPIVQRFNKDLIINGPLEFYWHNSQVDDRGRPKGATHPTALATVQAIALETADMQGYTSRLDTMINAMRKVA